MVEVKFNSYIIIRHHYNNIFAFHMHTFIIFALILNTHNIAIHQNYIFMVISYNQIYTSKSIVKNSRNKIIIHFIIFCWKKAKTTIKICGISK